MTAGIPFAALVSVTLASAAQAGEVVLVTTQPTVVSWYNSATCDVGASGGAGCFTGRQVVTFSGLTEGWSSLEGKTLTGDDSGATISLAGWTLLCTDGDKELRRRGTLCTGSDSLPYYPEFLHLNAHSPGQGVLEYGENDGAGGSPAFINGETITVQ